MVQRNKTHIVQVRLQPEEHEELEKLVAQSPFDNTSEYIRDKLFGASKDKITFRKLLSFFELAHEVVTKEDIRKILKEELRRIK